MSENGDTVDPAIESGEPSTCPRCGQELTFEVQSERESTPEERSVDSHHLMTIDAAGVCTNTDCPTHKTDMAKAVDDGQ